MSEDKDTEIARLRAELAETQAVLLASAATGARHMDQVADLRAELAREAEQTKIVLDNYAAENQRFSDEIERLRDIIRRALAYHEAEELELIEAWIDDARAALAPQENKP